MSTQSPSQFRQSPLKVTFVITSLPVGGAETLLFNLVKSFDKSLVQPSVVCLKEPGQLGEAIAAEVPLVSKQLNSKWDLRVLRRLTQTFRSLQTDVVVTVGAGDKMFWGRIAAKLARVPVICSALHSTGWPDGVGRLNRMLTRITDGFIACANGHARHLVAGERFPENKVFMIPNGVDTARFQPNSQMRDWLRDQLEVPSNTNLVGIVAALREEKNHQQLIRAAGDLSRHYPDTHFVIVGEGPCRPAIEAAISERGLVGRFHLLGNRSDTERILAGLDVFTLTSKNEANPVSILEALACGVPVVAPNVGSISETVIHEKTGLLTDILSFESTSDAITRLLGNPALARELGAQGRELVQNNWSLEAMVDGYQRLIEMLYNSKATKLKMPIWQNPDLSVHAEDMPVANAPIVFFGTEGSLGTQEIPSVG